MFIWANSVKILSLRSYVDILYPYKDERRDIRSNITLCLKKFMRAKPEGTPECKGLYLTVYPESSPNADIISFLTIFRPMFTSLFSLTISPYTP